MEVKHTASHNPQKELGHKLKSLRESLNLTVKDASGRMGFDSYQVLSNIENGERPVKTYELAKFSKIYCKDIGYFFREEKEIEEPVVMWRDRANIPDIKEKENRLIKYCENYFSLELKTDSVIKDAFKIEDIEQDKFSFPSVESLAIKIWTDLQLGSRPSCSLWKILEDNLGVKIIFLDLGEAGSGASAKGKFGSAIILNRNNAPWRTNYDLAHEFFHLLTWGKFPIEDIHAEKKTKTKVEQWADYFASCILLPEDALIPEFNKRLKDHNISYIDCIDLAREFAVSTKALLFRLANLKRLDNKLVKEVIEDEDMKRLDRQRRAEDRRASPYLSDRYIYLAFKCYNLNLLSKGKLAEYLDIDRADVSNFLASKGYSDKGDYSLELSTS